MRMNVAKDVQFIKRCHDCDENIGDHQNDAIAFGELPTVQPCGSDEKHDCRQQGQGSIEET